MTGSAEENMLCSIILPSSFMLLYVSPGNIKIWFTSSTVENLGSFASSFSLMLDTKGLLGKVPRISGQPLHPPINFLIFFG